MFDSSPPALEPYGGVRGLAYGGSGRHAPRSFVAERNEPALDHHWPEQLRKLLSGGDLTKREAALCDPSGLHRRQRQ
jgi:hypothetical protein